MLKKIPAWAIVLLILIIIVVFSLWLRIFLPYNQVFVGNWVKITGIDGNYYMRLVDNLVQHFPALTKFDPYYIFPGGVPTDREPNFFAYFMGFIIWLAGLGRPDQHLADVVGVFIPPFLAAITVVITFFIGKALENRWAGLLAASMLAIMPGEFLNRSLLGYTDHHIAEVLWSTLFILLAMLAFKLGNGIDLIHIRDKGWRPIIKPLLASLFAGVALALYMLTWAGAALFILILFLFICIQIILDYKRGVSTFATGAIGIVIFLVALIIYWPASRSSFSLVALLGGMLLIAALVLLSVPMAQKKVRTLYYVLAIAVSGGLATLVMYLVTPDLLATGLDYLSRIFSWKQNTTIMEMQPLLLQRGDFTLFIALGNYTSGFLLGLAGLALLVYRVFKGATTEKVLLLTWTLLIVLSALAMRRFAYYLAVNMALLTGYFVWWVLSMVGFGRPLVAAVQQQVAARTKAGRKKQAGTAGRQAGRKWIMALVLIVVLVVMICPNLGPLPNGDRPSIDLASQPLFAPPDVWCATMDWLRLNTPEPLGNASDYYALYKAPGQPGGYVYPQDAYGVLAWWDYGYWITRMGRRIPFSNPGTSGERGEAKYFMAPDESAAAQVIKDINIRYVIIDSEIASFNGKFFALATWYDKTYQDYFDLYLENSNGQYIPVLLFYPEYFQTMVVRLYNFDGKQVIPKEVNVIGITQVTGRDGAKYKAISEIKTFPAYEEAVSFVGSKPAGTYRIVGDSPFNSPVPLEAVHNYKLVHESQQRVVTENISTAQIKIFEYQP